MRKAEVYLFDRLAGRIWEREPYGFAFAYDDSYRKSPDALPISHLMPIQDAPYIGETLFPFFDGLIPEGWLLDVALRNTDISILDRMSLLLLCCKECIGSVSVVPINKEGGE